MHPRTTLSRLLGGVFLLAGLAGLPGQASAAGVNLVQNGGFETGSFSSWTEIGDTTFNGVQCPGGGLVPELECDGFFGPIGTLGGIQQSIATTLGGQYAISFILRTDGSAGSFLADFGALNLLTLTNPAAGTTTYNFFAAATAASSLLRFQFRDDAGFMELDAVQLAVPEPGSLALLGLGLIALVADHRRKTG